MIFIFDWGHTTRREAGPLSETDFTLSKEEANPDKFLTLAMYTEWFRLFFIPVIPTSRRYVMRRHDGLEVPVDKAFYEKYKPLAALNRDVVDGKISEAEYDLRRGKFGL